MSSKHKTKRQFKSRNSKLSDETEGYFPYVVNRYGDRITKATKATHFYQDTRRIHPEESKNETKIETQVRVVNGDTIDVAFLLQQEGLNPVVLNMASAWTPGGGWRKGSRAQEESLFYRSTMAISLENCLVLDRERDWHYPLPEYGAVYSPDIFIFRANAKQKYSIYEWKNCCWMNFMAVAAVRKPRLTKQNRLKEADKNKMLTKIDGMFKIALDKKHDSLVLGAFGCGAYGNPPEDVAQLFKVAIQPYLGKFKRITFAILDDHNAHQKHNPHGNLSVFRRVFAE